MTGRGVLSHGASPQQDGIGPHSKRSCRRAIRAYSLWGRSHFRKQRILTWRGLVQFFPLTMIAQVRDQIAHQRQYWAQAMYATTTDDASLATRLNIEQNIQQTWGTAHMAGRITGAEYKKQIAEHERNVVQLLAKPTASIYTCLLYTSPSPRDGLLSRMPSSA